MVVVIFILYWSVLISLTKKSFHNNLSWSPSDFFGFYYLLWNNCMFFSYVMQMTPKNSASGADPCYMYEPCASTDPYHIWCRSPLPFSISEFLLVNRRKIKHFIQSILIQVNFKPQKKIRFWSFMFGKTIRSHIFN